MVRFSLVTALLFASVLTVLAAEPKSETPNIEAISKAMAEMSKPGEEHQKLKPLAGEFTYTCKFWMDPSQSPFESTGTIQRKWVLGDRFLEETVIGKNFDGSKFEGRGLIGYDKAKKKYTTSWVCSMGTGTTTAVGTADSSGKKFNFDSEMFCPIQNKQMQGRDELRLESEDKHVMVTHIIDNGKENKMMELTATRKK